jgi:hypothetical protein
MGTDNSSKKFQNTLGFFFGGIPVIFVKGSIALGADPLLNEYLEIWKKSQQEPKSLLDFSNERLCRGFQCVMTMVHELRHFHDALLSRPLFELFVLQAKRNLYVAQLARRIRVDPDELPLRSGQTALRLSSEAIAFFEEIKRVGANYNTRFQEIWDERYLLDKVTINLEQLLETSAILSELLHLMVEHGIEAAEHYYNKLIRFLPSRYNSLLEYFSHKCGNLHDAVVLLSLLLIRQRESNEAVRSTHRKMWGKPRELTRSLQFKCVGRVLC